MKTHTRKEVEEAIAKIFPEAQRAGVLAYLSMYGEEASEPEQRRVQLAILDLSKGDFERLIHFVDAAKKDYRDVLYWSEYSS